MNENIKLVCKRSRTKKKQENSSDNSNDEYLKRKVSSSKGVKRKTKKVTTMKKAIQLQGQQKKKKRNKYGFTSSSEESEQQQLQQPTESKIMKVSVDCFNSDKVFAEILNKANKQPDFLIMLKNLLSGCSRQLRDKKIMIKRKWQQLWKSNYPPDEYLKKQSLLKKMEYEEIYGMEKDIMNKLAYANIKGFETKEALIDEYRQIKLKGSTKIDEDLQYKIDEKVWQKYHEQQQKLLALLMKQNDFVSQDHHLVANLEPQNSKQQFKQQNIEDAQIDNILNTIETEENPRATQFFFCQHYKDIAYDKIFESNQLKILDNQKFFIGEQAMGWLLQSKSDEIYTNQNYQKETHEKYIGILKNLYSNNMKFTDKEVMSKLLEVAAYVLNSVHYYRKFKLKCDLLHPLDLLLVVEKCQSIRQNKMMQIQQSSQYKNVVGLCAQSNRNQNRQL